MTTSEARLDGGRQAKTYALDDIIVVVMRGSGFTALEQTIRASEGPLATIRGERPEDVAYAGSAEHLQDVWIALRGAIRGVVDNVTLADLAAGRPPSKVRRLAEDPASLEVR